MRRPFLLFLSITLPCSACASMAARANLSRAVSGVGTGTHSATATRRVFTSHLSAGDAGPNIVPRVGESTAWGTVRIVVNDDDSFEYLATIYNPRAETFTGAFLTLNGGDGTVLATLFSDVTLRSQYIQLRGTVSIGRGERDALIAEKMREKPHAFAVSVHTATSPRSGAIRGIVE